MRHTWEWTNKHRTGGTRLDFSPPVLLLVHYDLKHVSGIFHCDLVLTSLLLLGSWSFSFQDSLGWWLMSAYVVFFLISHSWNMNQMSVLCSLLVCRGETESSTARFPQQETSCSALSSSPALSSPRTRLSLFHGQEIPPACLFPALLLLNLRPNPSSVGVRMINQGNCCEPMLTGSIRLWFYLRLAHSYL